MCSLETYLLVDFIIICHFDTEWYSTVSQQNCQFLDQPTPLTDVIHGCSQTYSTMTKSSNLHVWENKSNFMRLNCCNFSFNFNLKLLWNWSFFDCEKIITFINVLSNLELEGQGCGIIMGVIGLILLGPWFLHM